MQRSKTTDTADDLALGSRSCIPVPPFSKIGNDTPGTASKLNVTLKFST